MLQTPHIVQSVEQATAFIRVTVPRSEIRGVMGPGLAELMSIIAAQGIAPTGPWFTHHLKMDPEIFDVKISLPVSTPVAPAGRVQAGVLPAAKVARTIYRGSYERLGEAWEEFMSWIGNNGLTPANDLWESYKIGPADTLNPSSWHTELNQPLVD
jgi:effector-binding domain-containing protein